MMPAPERPLTITRDTREPYEHTRADPRDPCATCGAPAHRPCEPVLRPWVFAPGISRTVPYADRPRVYLPTVRGKIDEGDYAPAGMEAHVSIEFKRGPDLIATLFGEREGGDSLGERAPNLERFRAELERAQKTRAHFGIVVGASEGWVFSEAKRRVERYGKSYDPFNVFDLLRGFRTDLGVWTVFAGSLEMAELEIGATLTRVWSQATNGAKAKGARKRGYTTAEIPWLGAVLPEAAKAAE